MSPPRVDVAVIGAGLSGLLAAWRLRAAGRSVVVFEARDRLGGRIHAGGPPEDAVELGPSWVWDHETHVHALLEELGISTLPHHREGIDLYETPAGLQRGRLPRSSIPERRLRGGTPALVAALAERAGPVRCGTAVTAVAADPDHPSGELQLSAGGQTWRAGAVLAALPPALLAATVALPGLSAERRALLAATPTWMEDVAKVVVRYPRRFWRDQGLSGRAASRVGPLVELHDLSGPAGAAPALFGFLPRPLHGPQWREQVRAQLVRLFGPEAGAPLAVHAAAWWTEAHTAAPRSRPPDQRLLGAAVLREPLLGGRLHLTSTETSGRSPGHLDGAVERAEAAARALA